MRTINFSQNVMTVFANNETSYDEVRNLMEDLALGRTMYDADGKVVPKAVAEEKLRDINRQIFGITKESTKRDRQRAYRDHAREWFDVIEEVIDNVLYVGFRESEWFQDLVDYRNIALDDAIEFWTDADDVILSIAEVGRSHHDTILQRLPEGQKTSISTKRYEASVGADIDRYLIGAEDWTKLVGAISRSFNQKVTELIYTALTGAVSKLPVSTGFIGTGVLDASTKADFDDVVANVSIANNNSNIIIMGTQVALKKINDLAKDVVWTAPSQKESVAAIGRLGNYETAKLVEIPQRFKDKTYSEKLYSDNVLYIFAANSDDKLIKFIDQGETYINEVTEKGEANGRYDDIMKYEVQREFGAAALVSRQFGQWKFVDE